MTFVQRRLSESRDTNWVPLGGTQIVSVSWRPHVAMRLTPWSPWYLSHQKKLLLMDVHPSLQNLVKGSNPCALVGKRHSLGYASIVSIHKVIQSGKVFSHDQSLPNENSFTLLLLVLIASGPVGRFQQWSESRNETQVWCFQSISMLCLDIIPCWHFMFAFKILCWLQSKSVITSWNGMKTLLLYHENHQLYGFHCIIPISFWWVSPNLPYPPVLSDVAPCLTSPAEQSGPEPLPIAKPCESGRPPMRKNDRWMGMGQVTYALVMTNDSYLIIYLVGGIPTPLKNLSSSVGVIIPNIWKNMFQTYWKWP